MGMLMPLTFPLVRLKGVKSLKMKLMIFNQVSNTTSCNYLLLSRQCRFQELQCRIEGERKSYQLRCIAHHHSRSTNCEQKRHSKNIFYSINYKIHENKFINTYALQLQFWLCEVVRCGIHNFF